MPDRMPDRMPENMSDRMPEDLPVTKCINVMVGITRSKVILWGVHSTRRLVCLGDAIVKISGFLASGSLTYLSNMEKKVRTSPGFSR